MDNNLTNSNNLLKYENYTFLKELTLTKENFGCYNGKEWCGSTKTLQVLNPHDNSTTALIKIASEDQYEQCINSMIAIKDTWMNLSMVKRGLIIQEIRENIKEKIIPLGHLVSLETGKTLSEGIFEIQEIVEVCDYAIGLSRIIGGKIYPSEKDNQQILEQWNPIGLMGILTAFNFPAAVFAINTAISMVCGNVTIWKATSNTSLISIAVTKIWVDVLFKHNLGGVLTLVVGHGSSLSELMVKDDRLKLISFTGHSEVNL